MFHEGWCGTLHQTPKDVVCGESTARRAREAESSAMTVGHTSSSIILHSPLTYGTRTGSVFIPSIYAFTSAVC